MKWVRTADWKLYSDGRLFDMVNDDREENPLLSKNDSKEKTRARTELTKAFGSLDLP